MSPHLRRVCTVLATALVGALISCTAVRKGNFTIVDLGGAVNNIGLAEPHLREEPLPPRQKTASPTHQRARFRYTYTGLEKG